MADANVDAYTKWVSNMRSVSQVNSAWNSASCTPHKRQCQILVVRQMQ